MSDKEFVPEMYKDLLPIYYKQLFPYSSYFKWLSYGGKTKNYFNHREFSFTIEDIYIRYQSFKDLEELQKELQRRCPHKIDIGAVYNVRPKDIKQVAGFQPLEKELVFDIDMTDYDDVRTCCSGAEICGKCWKFMVVAVKVLDAALREDFGWEQLLWVYSGRRGIHCWVCDEGARRLTGQARSAVAEYLQVCQGGEHQSKKVLLKGSNIHPSVARADDIIKKHFWEVCIKDQDIMGDTVQWTKVLKLIPDDGLKPKFIEKFQTQSTTAERWNYMTEQLAIAIRNGTAKKTNGNIVKEIQLQYMYPRLDINVTKGLNHLLKSPFCIHPKTGRVCIPIDPKLIDDFDPMEVPTINQLISELDASDDKENSAEKGYKHTSLQRSVQYFESFLKAHQVKEKLIEASDKSMEF